MTATTWRLYAKHPGQKRFSAINWATGKQVVNLIHATLFTSEERAQVEQDLAHPDNADVTTRWEKVR